MSIALPFALTSLYSPQLEPSPYYFIFHLISPGPCYSPHKIIPHLQLALLYFSGFFCYATRGLELGPVDEREHMVSVSWLPQSTLSFLVLFTYLKFSLQMSNSPACMVPHVHYLLFCGRALGCFHLLAAVNRAARGIAQRASVTCKVKSFGCVTSSATVGSDANCICSF